MFTKITPATDSQLTNQHVANIMLDDAINKIALLTGLSAKEAFALISVEVSQQAPVVKSEKNTMKQPPLLDQNEFQFISSLFN